MCFIQLQANVLDLSFCKALFYLMIPQENHQQICPPKRDPNSWTSAFWRVWAGNFGWWPYFETHGKLVRDRCRNKLGETPNFPTKTIRCAYSNGRKSSIRLIKLPRCQRIFWETSKAGPLTWLQNLKTCVCLHIFPILIIISECFVWTFGCFVVGDLFF